MKATTANMLKMRAAKKVLRKTIKNIDKGIIETANNNKSRVVIHKKNYYTKNIEILFDYYTRAGFTVTHKADLLIITW